MRFQINMVLHVEMTEQEAMERYRSSDPHTIAQIMTQEAAGLTRELKEQRGQMTDAHATVTPIYG